MAVQLRVLVVEDSETDTLLMLRALRQAGFEPVSERVASAADMSARLEAHPWDLILCDYALPRFSGADALTLYKATGKDIPFIVVSGALGEERAVEMMKTGAHDYVLKNNLARLPEAVKRELRAAEERRVRRHQEATVAYLAAIVESCQDAIVGVTLNGAIVSWNAGAQALFGYADTSIIGRPVEQVIPVYKPGDLSEMYRRLNRDEPIDRFETRGLRQDGTSVELALTHSPLKDWRGEIIGASVLARDISRRKRQEAERLQLIYELTEALARVKTLSGLLPICASCKKIRDDQGYWQQVETYIRQRSEADFTHGICPDCAQRLYPEIKLKNGAVSAAAA
jgi:PAS domain S-box-containing protein